MKTFIRHNLVCEHGPSAPAYLIGSRCVECAARGSADGHRRRARNPEYWRRYFRERDRARQGLPGPTRPDPTFCECCGLMPESKNLCVDHDHVTGKFRGWLCIKCNLAIGALGDSVEGLERAVAYIRRAL